MSEKEPKPQIASRREFLTRTGGSLAALSALAAACTESKPPAAGTAQPAQLPVDVAAPPLQPRHYLLPHVTALGGGVDLAQQARLVEQVLGHGHGSKSLGTGCRSRSLIRSNASRTATRGRRSLWSRRS